MYVALEPNQYRQDQLQWSPYTIYYVLSLFYTVNMYRVVPEAGSQKLAANIWWAVQKLKIIQGFKHFEKISIHSYIYIFYQSN